MWEREVDVVVIGFGIAGACAAIEAKQAGADVLVLERASGGGGASALSSGIFYLGGGTAVQKAFGYEDSGENMYRFLMASTEAADPESVKTFADHSQSHFEWLEKMGVPFERTEFKGKAVFLNTSECLFSTGNENAWPYSLIANPVPRGHKVAGVGENAGAIAMQAILGRCSELGVTTDYDCRVTSIIQDANQRVLGVRYRQSGKERCIRARRGVVIATGGFNMNESMVREHIPLMSSTAQPLGMAYNDGSGIHLGAAAGGCLTAMDGVIATASIYPPDQLIKGILVNAQGKRFVAEDSYHGRTASMIMEQPGQTAYLIVDEEIFAYPEIASAQHRLVDGWESVGDMEQGLGMPSGALARTLNEYNRDARDGKDTVLFKASKWLKPLEHGPYAAFDVSFNRSIYLYMTLGGLTTNARAEVLSSQGEPIPGLYAAGACAAHIPQSGKTYASGMSLGPGSFFGRVAGKQAAGQEHSREL